MTQFILKDAAKMTYKEIYEKAVSELKSANIDEAELDAFYLLSFVTGLRKADYYLKLNEAVDERVTERYFELIKRRAMHMPCQYITGSAEFMGLEFEVSRAVLIPRQDTETLVEKAVEVIRKIGIADKFAIDCDERGHTKEDDETELSDEGKQNSVSDEEAETSVTKNISNNIKILDMCTGSGCIAVSVKHFCKHADVTAVDISDSALEIAKHNAEKNGAEIEFVKSDMFEKLDGRMFDVILSNPPYVTESEYETLMPEVKDNEPKLALTAGADGLDFYKIIANEAPMHLKRNGKLILEIGCEQAQAVKNLLEENRFSNIQIIKDLPGLDRVVYAEIF